MKRILAVLLAASMTVGLTACGGNGSGTSSGDNSNGSTASQGEEAKEPAQKDKTLVVGVPANFEEKWNPFMAENAYDQQVMEQIFTAPQRINASNEMTDWAGSITYEEQADGSVIYTVKAKEGMTFSDGEPITIDDYIYSLYVLSDPSYTGPAALITEDIEGIKEYYYDDPNYTSTIESIAAEVAEKYSPGTISEEDFITYLKETNLEGWWNGKPDGDIGDGETTWSKYIEAEGFGDDLAAIDATDPDAMLELLAKVEYTNYADGYDPAAWYQNKLESEYIAGNLEDGIDVAEITGITRVDDYTATVKYNSVNIYGDRAINAYFAPEHYYGEIVKGDVASIISNMEPVGSGPYMWGGFSDNIVTCTANVSYFEGVPNIGTVKWQYVPEADTIAALAGGEIDIANPAGSKENVEELEAQGITFDLTDNAGYGYMGLNCANLSQNVRKGLLSLMNRRPSVEGYYGPEIAQVIERPMTTVLSEYPQDAGVYYEYSPEKALEYFETAGYSKDASGNLVDKDGNKLVVNVYIGGSGVGNHPGYAMLTQAANDMASLGAELQIQDVDFNVLQGAMNDGTADMWVMAWGAVNSCDKSTQFKSTGGQNRYRIADAELDKMLDEIIVTIDLDARKELVSKMLDKAMDLAIELPLYQRKNIIAYNEQNVDMSSIPEDTSAFWDYGDVLWTVKMN